MIRRTILAMALGMPLVAIGQTTYECVYPTYSDGESVRRTTERFALTFLVDNEKKSAYVIGNAGSSSVSLIPSTEGPTFVEVTAGGNVMATVVDSDGRSAHSRG